MLKKLFRQWLQATKPLLLFYLLFLLVSFVGRVVLLGQHYGPLKASGVNYWMAFVIGLRMDTIAVCIILALPTLLIFLTPPFLRRIGEKLVGIYLLLTLLLAVYMEIATPPFVNEFDARPNELFVNYLQYPREVISTILSTQLFPLLIAIVSLSLIVWCYLRWWRKSSLFTRALSVSYGVRLLFLLPTALIVFMGIRSSLIKP